MARTRFCEVCKKEIDQDRLEVVPDTHLCTEHAREIQRYGGEFKVTAEQERTSKPGSLKLNYGGVSTSQTRNEEAIRKLRDDYLLRS